LVGGGYMDSILLHTKHLLGIPNDADIFDPAVLTAINTAIFSLKQVGLVIPANFVVTGSAETWSDLLGETVLESVKSYIYLKTRVEFDPPSSSFLISAMQAQLDELVYRIFVELDTPLVE